MADVTKASGNSMEKRNCIATISPGDAKGIGDTGKVRVDIQFDNRSVTGKPDTNPHLTYGVERQFKDKDGSTVNFTDFRQPVDHKTLDMMRQGGTSTIIDKEAAEKTGLKEGTEVITFNGSAKIAKSVKMNPETHEPYKDSETGKPMLETRGLKIDTSKPIVQNTNPGVGADAYLAHRKATEAAQDAAYGDKINKMEQTVAKEAPAPEAAKEAQMGE